MPPPKHVLGHTFSMAPCHWLRLWAGRPPGMGSRRLPSVRSGTAGRFSCTGLPVLIRRWRASESGFQKRGRWRLRWAEYAADGQLWPVLLGFITRRRYGRSSGRRRHRAGGGFQPRGWRAAAGRRGGHAGGAYGTSSLACPQLADRVPGWKEPGIRPRQAMKSGSAAWLVPAGVPLGRAEP